MTVKNCSMRFVLLISLLSLTNCQNRCSNEFNRLLRGDEWQTIMEFKTPKSVYKPSYESFLGFSSAKQKHRVDLLYRSVFTHYLQTVFQNERVQYDQLLLIEVYSTGERISHQKLILFKCGSAIQSFSFKRISKTWVLANKPLSYSEKDFAQWIDKAYSPSADVKSSGNFKILTHIVGSSVQRVMLLD